ncbi:MAG TPA: hypothetical protein VGM03_15840 [Phycisphaerae bacterium]|jgi:hypothetical protein
MGDWPVEDIPSGDSFYKRVHRNLFKPDGTVMTGAFAHREMSVDWSKYSTPEETRQRADNPSDQAVLEMNVGEVRQVAGQSVEHAPLASNRARSHVIGNKNA